MRLFNLWDGIFLNMDDNRKPSSRFLTYPHTPFHGCTMNETVMIMLIYLILETPLSLILAYFLQGLLGGYVGALLIIIMVFILITFLILIKQTAKLLGKLRQGKPPGYIKIKTDYVLYLLLGKPIPYILHQGYWLTRRHIKIRGYQK